ncbi:MAG: hypothetical protein HY328_07270 [Chloroflexi bacterium]|nr:hypothetical protein [Chloroflexota bacterium]
MNETHAVCSISCVTPTPDVIADVDPAQTKTLRAPRRQHSLPMRIPPLLLRSTFIFLCYICVQNTVVTAVWIRGAFVRACCAARAGITAPLAIDQITEFIPSVYRQRQAQAPTSVPFLSDPQMIGLPVVEITGDGNFIRPQAGGQFEGDFYQICVW